MTKITISKETLNKLIANFREKKVAFKEKSAIQELMSPELTDKEFDAYCVKLEEVREKLNSIYEVEEELLNRIAEEASKEAKHLLNYIIGGIVFHSDDVMNETIIQILSLLNIEVHGNESF